MIHPLSLIVIILVTIAVSVIGSAFSMRGVKTWYPTIKKPSWTPPGAVIGAVWTVLYILAAISAILVWDIEPRPAGFLLIAAMFVLNALVNLSWSYVFFVKHKIGFAIWVSLFLDLTVVVLIQLIAPVAPLAGWLLVPYAAWVTFASWLNYRIWGLAR
jgi:benzodiazapine receptor